MAETRRRRFDRKAPSEAADPRPNLSGGEDRIREVTGEAIARRAYELYERRGGEHGRDWDDWFHAEQEIRAEGDALANGSAALAETDESRDR